MRPKVRLTLLLFGLILTSLTSRLKETVAVSVELEGTDTALPLLSSTVELVTRVTGFVLVRVTVAELPFFYQNRRA